MFETLTAQIVAHSKQNDNRNNLIVLSLCIEFGSNQTWEPVKPGVPKEVKGGYPETKILRVG
jgi:hypothetical protein